jgi:hypothetical protein
MRLAWKLGWEESVMTREAERILSVFGERRAVKPGDLVGLSDFGEAIVWEDGFVRDEDVREALRLLFSEGSLVEANVALVLTEKGAAWLEHQTESRRGARVYFLRKTNTLLIKQTVLRGTPPEYVLDGDRELHVAFDDDAAIAAAVRNAVTGRL